MFPTVQPGTAMSVKDTRAGEACIIIITGPYLCPIIGFLENLGYLYSRVARVSQSAGFCHPRNWLRSIDLGQFFVMDRHRIAVQSS